MGKKVKTLKGYDSNNNLVVTVNITGWPQEAIDKIKNEIQIGPIGRKIGKIEWVEVSGE